MERRNDFPMFRAGAVLLGAVLLIVGGITLASRLRGGDDADGRARASSPPATAERDGGDGREKGPAASGEYALGGVCRAGESTPLPSGLEESSGVAVSRRTAGAVWTHNDSGEPLLYAVGADGGLLGTVRVQGATVEDWEDAAVGPCPAGECLYVADIGDNDGARASVTIYRFPEPAPGDGQTRPAEALRARFPDGPQDAEALFVTAEGQVHLVTKGDGGPVAVYRLPEGGAGGVAVLERVRTLAEGEVPRRNRITGAAASPDGRWIALRTLDGVSFYAAGPLLSGAGEASPRIVDLKELDEPQGEAVAFAPDGSVVLTSEAGRKDNPGLLSRLECRLE